ncbi:MAG: hypothetical protein ABSC29_04440, partial [Minisyncoccia bacterium]
WNNDSGFIVTSTYNASITIATVGPLGGAGKLANNGTITLTFSTSTALTWGAAQTFVATATFNSSTILTGLTNAFLAVDGNGKVITTSTPFLTTSTGLTVNNFATSSIGQWANNVGYVTAASSVTWTAAITHVATTTFNSSTIFTGITGTLLSADTNGKVQTTTFGGTGLSFSGNTLTWTNPGYISGNQSITFTASGDVSGTTSGAVSLTPSLTITGLQGKALPSLATGTLFYKTGAWALGNAVDVNGNQYVTSQPVVT